MLLVLVLALVLALAPRGGARSRTAASLRASVKLFGFGLLCLLGGDPSFSLLEHGFLGRLPFDDALTALPQLRVSRGGGCDI